MRVKTPRARSDGLLVEELADELLVYDLERQCAHCLNRTAALVWRDCNGRRAPAELAARLRATLGGEVDEPLIELTLARLAAAHLLDGAAPVAARGPSRRQVMRGLALLPAVTSILAPRATQAASCVGLGKRCLMQNCCPGLRCVGKLHKTCQPHG
jgi:hypothetical protein